MSAQNATRASTELSWVERPFAELLRLAWPIAISTVSYSVMTLVDTIFVGQLGASALAGVGLGGVAAFTLLVFPIGLLRGVKVVVSQAVGAGRQREVAPYVGAGVAMALGLGLLAALLGQLAADQLPRFAASEEAGEIASSYLSIRILGAPMLLLFVALREGRYGQGETRLPMVAAVLANVLNIVLDYTLIYGFELGAAGAAWASVAATGAEALVLILGHRGGVRRGLRSIRHVAAICRVGFPTGLQFLIEVGSFTVLTILISAMGEVDMASHQIALHAIHVSFLPALAVGEAASVMVGQAVGAGRDDQVLPVATMAMRLTGAYTAICSLVFVFGSEAVVAVFTPEESVRIGASALLLVAAFFQIADAANIVARSVLRGTGDVNVPAVIAVFTAWVATPPLAWFLGIELGWGALGGWIGLCIEIIAAAGFLWWRMWRGSWRRAAERSRNELESLQEVDVAEAAAA